LIELINNHDNAHGQAMEALACIHNAGMVHRDIKPANIAVRVEDDIPLNIEFPADVLRKANELAAASKLVQSEVKGGKAQVFLLDLGLLIAQDEMTEADGAGTQLYYHPKVYKFKKFPVGNQRDYYALGLTALTIMVGLDNIFDPRAMYWDIVADAKAEKNVLNLLLSDDDSRAPRFILNDAKNRIRARKSEYPLSRQVVEKLLMLNTRGISEQLRIANGDCTAGEGMDDLFKWANSARGARG
jgi:serine/threonine protein kinase